MLTRFQPVYAGTVALIGVVTALGNYHGQPRIFGAQAVNLNAQAVTLGQQVVERRT